MEAVYHCHINELSEDFFKSLKKQFSNALVDIVIKDIDETDYLLSSEANKQALLQSIAEVNAMKLVVKSAQELGLKEV